MAEPFGLALEPDAVADMPQQMRETKAIRGRERVASWERKEGFWKGLLEYCRLKALIRESGVVKVSIPSHQQV